MPTHYDRRKRREGDLREAKARRDGNAYYDFGSRQIVGGQPEQPIARPGTTSSPGNAITDRLPEARQARDRFLDETRFNVGSRPAYDPGSGQATQEPTVTRPRVGQPFRKPTPPTRPGVRAMTDIPAAIGSDAINHLVTAGTVPMVMAGDALTALGRYAVGGEQVGLDKTRRHISNFEDRHQQNLGQFRGGQAAARQALDIPPAASVAARQEQAPSREADSGLSPVNVGANQRTDPLTGRFSTSTPGIDAVVNSDGSITYTNLGEGEQNTSPTTSGGNLSVVPAFQGRGLTRPRSPRSGNQEIDAGRTDTRNVGNRGVFNPVTRNFEDPFETRRRRQTTRQLSSLDTALSRAVANQDDRAISRLGDAIQAVQSGEAGVRQNQVAGQAGVDQQRIASRGRIGEQQIRANAPDSLARADLYGAQGELAESQAGSARLINALQNSYLGALEQGDEEGANAALTALRNLSGDQATANFERIPFETIGAGGASEFVDGLIDPRTGRTIPPQRTAAARQVEIDRLIADRAETAGISIEDARAQIEDEMGLNPIRNFQNRVNELVRSGVPERDAYAQARREIGGR